VQKVVGLGNLVTGLLIGGDQRRGAQPQWHQPARIFFSQMPWRRPDGLLIAKNVFEEFTFERRLFLCGQDGRRRGRSESLRLYLESDTGANRHEEDF
jgi:hypothetical protein